MNKGNSFAKKPKEVTQKSEKKCKEFEAISKFFSKEEWAKLGYSDKITYVYMKRNYDIMTGLGNRKFWVQTSLGTHHYPLSPFTCYGFFLGCKCPTPALCAGRNPRATSEPEAKTVGIWCPEDVENRLCRMPVGTWEGGGISLSEKNKTKQNRDLYSPTQPTLIYQLFSTIGSKKGKNIWANRLRQRKNLIAYEEISDPEEDD
uniref:KRAB-related domain-containing protein n=1 Tax=Panthera leo TaxID=9689 RepID=A0A8C9D7N9_PANLE